MNKTLKRVLTLALALVMLLSLSVAAFADEGEIHPVTGTITRYMSYDPENSNYTSSSFWLTIASADKNFTIKRSSVKVTAGTADAKLYGFEKYFRGSDFQYDYSGDKTWGDSSSNRYYDYELGIRISKPGTFTVKYKIGTTSYSIKVKVLKYVNPIKTITLSGVNSGKSFASETKYENSNWSDPLSLPAKKTGASLKVTAKDGWKITSIELADNTKGTYRSYYCYSSPVSSFTLKCGTLYANRQYELYLNLVNTKNGASQTLIYSINGAKA